MASLIAFLIILALCYIVYEKCKKKREILVKAWKLMENRVVKFNGAENSVWHILMEKLTLFPRFLFILFDILSGF